MVKNIVKIFTQSGEEIQVDENGKVPFELCVCESNIVKKTRKSGETVNFEKRKYYVFDENKEKIIVKLDGTVKFPNVKSTEKKKYKYPTEAKTDEYLEEIKKTVEEIKKADKHFDDVCKETPFSIERYQEASKELQRKKDHLLLLKNYRSKSAVYLEHYISSLYV